jgi:hypothetical protein
MAITNQSRTNTMTKYYAGIGSRKTPTSILETMTKIARLYEANDWKLRSGGAIGADSAFEAGVQDNSNKEIFYAKDATDEALELAASVHPAWHRCNDYVRKLHARNCMQILGKDLNTPVKLVICWTPNGERTGGTGQALRLADKYGIPIVNLAADPVPRP